MTVHDRDYVERVARAIAGSKGDAGDGISPFGRGGFEVMRLAAGAVISAVDVVADGTIDNAYALVRPSGHHALPDRGMGMAYFGNVAIAAKHAREHHDVGRVAIVDWDVHHGNGTQHAFIDDPEVLTVSLHQDNVFPRAVGR